MQFMTRYPAMSSGFRSFAFCTLAVAVTVPIACTPEPEPDAVHVFAAASIADAVEAVGRRYAEVKGVRVIVTRGASGILGRQIESGADCDVFVPAHRRFTDRLAVHDDVRVTHRCDVARNRLALIVRRGFTIEGDRFSPTTADASREQLADVLGRAQRISIANAEHAPAGRYARQALDALGVSDAVASRLVYGDDVRLAARYVAQGAADCGIVYLSDASAFADQIGEAMIVPAALHEPIVYEACATSNAPRAAAFVEFLGSDTASEIWIAQGLESISPKVRAENDPRPLETGNDHAYDRR